MKILASCAIVVSSSVGLLGCGSDNPAPTPVAYHPKDVATVWNNHFDAFAKEDLPKIMKDYDATSLVSLYDDTCPGAGGFRYITGTDNIQAMFTQLFEDVKPKAGNVIEADAKVINEKGLGGNVFLVWKTKGSADGSDGVTADKWIQYATDTFSFRTLENGDYKIWKQNIVVTRKESLCEEDQASTDKITLVAGEGQSTKIETAWENHEDAFKVGDVDAIKQDYTKDSIVQVHDWTAETKYTEFKGVEAIGGMFTELFKKLNPADPTSIVVETPLVTLDTDHKALFLVWKSTNVPHATDTFIFDDSGDAAIILRQNIVVHAAPAAGPSMLQVDV